MSKVWAFRFTVDELAQHETKVRADERKNFNIIIERNINQMRFKRLGANGLRIEELNNNILVLQSLMKEMNK